MSNLQVDNNQNVDDDGSPRRTGTLMSVTAHIITVVIGSGVLTLSWSMARLGWITGLTALLGFSLITYYTSTLLANLYRSEDGTRNRTYIDVVRTHLGRRKALLCGIALYLTLIGVTISYTLTAAISLVAVEKSICFHKKRPNGCTGEKQYLYMILFACIQIMLNQVPNFHKLSWLSVLVAAMSFIYSAIGIGLSIAKAAGGEHTNTSFSPMPKPYVAFQAIGNIAFSYAYSTIHLEIQDTIQAGPAENEVMKKASLASVSTATVFYMLCGCAGYATFGVGAPRNFLTDLGFHEPYWLIAVANVCVAIHLIGAYQVLSQPLFSFVESKCIGRWPDSDFVNIHHRLPVPYSRAVVSMNFFRLVWRSMYVVAATLVAAKLPFLNELLGLLGAASFYPLTVYFPIKMYLSSLRIPHSSRWVCLKVLCHVCSFVSIVACVGSVHGIINICNKHHNS